MSLCHNLLFVYARNIDAHISLEEKTGNTELHKGQAHSSSFIE